MIIEYSTEYSTVLWFKKSAVKHSVYTKSKPSFERRPTHFIIFVTSNNNLLDSSNCTQSSTQYPSKVVQVFFVLFVLPKCAHMF